MDELVEKNIPEPDSSGTQEVQTSQESNVVTKEPDSPISMGQTVSGLAAESHSGLNKPHN